MDGVVVPIPADDECMRRAFSRLFIHQCYVSPYHCDTFQGAVASYDRAIGFLLGSSARLLLPAALQGEEREEFIKCATNRAIAWYKLEDYARCAADCSAVLGLDPGHGKARCVQCVLQCLRSCML